MSSFQRLGTDVALTKLNFEIVWLTQDKSKVDLSAFSNNSRVAQSLSMQHWNTFPSIIFYHTFLAVKGSSLSKRSMIQLIFKKHFSCMFFPDVTLSFFFFLLTELFLFYVYFCSTVLLSSLLGITAIFRALFLLYLILGRKETEVCYYES